MTKALLLGIPLAILAGGWLLYINQSQTPSLNESTISDRADSQSSSPFDVQEIDEPIATQSIQIENTFETTQTTEDRGIAFQELDLDPLSDAEFRQLQTSISTNKSERLLVLDELSNYPTSDRARQLAILLGKFNDPELIDAASSLIYSGDIQSQKTGLFLLNQMQPHSNEARTLAINLLGSVDNPELLAATMNVFATPAKGASAVQRDAISSNMQSLSTHHDPQVRGLSLSIASRWQKHSVETVEMLANGLGDIDASVRSKAVYAANNVRGATPSMIEKLIAATTDVNNNSSVRYAAIRAVEKMRLTPEQRRLVTQAKQSLSSR